MAGDVRVGAVKLDAGPVGDGVGRGVAGAAAAGACPVVEVPEGVDDTEGVQQAITRASKTAMTLAFEWLPTCVGKTGLLDLISEPPSTCPEWQPGPPLHPSIPQLAISTIMEGHTRLSVDSLQ